MKQTKTYQVNWMLRAAAVLFCLVLLSLWMVSGLLARYTVSGTGSDSARTASFTVTADLDNFEQTFPVEINPYSGEQTVSVTVNNASETAIAFDFSLSLEGNLPLKLTYSTDGDTEEKELTDNTLTDSDSCQWQGNLPAGNENRIYTIHISWADDEKGYQYAHGVELITLSVTARQID